MGCNCKTNIGNSSSPTLIDAENIFIEGLSPESKSNHKTKTYLRYLINFIVFLFSLIFLPVIMFGVVAVMFQVLVVNDTLDMGKIAKIIAHKIKFANYDEEDLMMIYGDDNMDYEHKDEDEETQYVNLYDIEDIKEINTNVK